MTAIRQVLSERLKGVRKLAVLGIGSEYRQDDSAGMLAAQQLETALKKRKEHSKIKVFFGSTAPENLTGEIKKFRPSHIVIIDTAEMKEKPGTILVLDSNDIGSGVSFSTHKMPAKILVDYFVKSFKCKVIVIGIQPKRLEFGKPPSKEIIGSTKEVSAAIAGIIK